MSMSVETELLGNSLLRWAIALGIAAAVLAIARGLKALACTRLRSASDENTRRAAVVDVLDATRWFSYIALGVFAGSHAVAIRSGVANTVRIGALCVLLIQVGIWAQVGLRHGIGIWTNRRGDSPHAQTLAVGIRFVARLVIWTLILLTILSSLGIKISALVAGLGIGGVAVALAIQSLLSDIFASFSMYFDRPFDIGDTIVVGGTEGVIERIGWRSTRLRATEGQEVVFANGELIKQQIHNYSHMQRRHVECRIHLEYAAPDLVARVPSLLADAIGSVEGSEFERAQLKELGRRALVYEVEFSIEGSDQDLHKQRRHAVNLAILERFADEGIGFYGASKARPSLGRNQKRNTRGESRSQPH
jgi:small-conductance mechanosensitive channel